MVVTQHVMIVMLYFAARDRYGNYSAGYVLFTSDTNSVDVGFTSDRTIAFSGFTLDVESVACKTYNYAGR